MFTRETINPFKRRKAKLKSTEKERERRREPDKERNNTKQRRLCILLVCEQNFVSPSADYSFLLPHCFSNINCISEFMADLYGTTPPTSDHEPEEITSFLNQLIHNSSASSSFCLLPKPEDRNQFGQSADPSLLGSSSPAVVNFSNFKVAAVDSDTNDSEKGQEAPEVPSDSRIRNKTSSSKRSRAAEVHNMSEKRRRSRINEKMKALQNLIPNSNKTDKASMLDEAIEYLKQLQLQVQMLTMRNGLSLHPAWIPGVLQPMQLPQMGTVFDGGDELLNTNRATNNLSANEETIVKTAFNQSNQCTVSNQPMVISSMSDVSTSEAPFGHEPLIQANYAPFSFSSSKEIHSEGVPQVLLDMNFSGKSSSSVVS